MIEATADYFRGQDGFTQWLEDCCDQAPDYWEPPRLLFRSWEKWATDAHEDVGNQKQFAERLEKAGFVKQRARKYNGRAWIGLKVTTNAQSGDAWDA